MCMCVCVGCVQADVPLIEHFNVKCVLSPMQEEGFSIRVRD